MVNRSSKRKGDFDEEDDSKFLKKDSGKSKRLSDKKRRKAQRLLKRSFE